MQFGDLNDALRRHRWLVAGCGALAALMAGLLCLLLPKQYHAEVLVAPAEEDSNTGSAYFGGQLSGLAQIAGLNLTSNANIWVAVSTLESRVLAEEFIKSENLLPVLVPDDWDPENRRWKVTDDDQAPSLWDAYKVFDENIRRIDYNSTTQLVTVSMDWRDPAIAAEWANAFVKLANERMRQLAIAEAQRSIDVLQAEAAKTSKVELQQVIFRVIETNINRATLARIRDEFAFRVIDPAVPADADDYVWPRAEILLPVGLVFGLALGFGLAVIRVVWSRTA